jgi:hypothetical protein
MGEMLKELGKLFYNFALLIAGAVIIQPWVKGNYSFTTFAVGFLGIIGSIVLGSILIILGDKFKNKEE